ncbi:MAG: RNA methyltransferase [Caldilineaceae bacterium]|nr:RNA methyltransferase [Caldilineaceae bacterium]
MRITSLQNPHIKNCVKLQQRKERDRQQKMVIEGYRAILRAMQNRYPLHTLYYCPELFYGQQEPDLLRDAEQAGVTLLEVSTEPFRKMTTAPRPDGLLALAPQVRHTLAGYRPRPCGFFLVAEAIEKPSNLGAIIRSADGAGADALIVCDPQVDIFNPDVLRASVGTFFTLPLLAAGPKQAIQWCRAHGVLMLAATPQAETLYTNVEMRGPVAIAVGNEQQGLSQEWLCGADISVKLPMCGQINSLNVAVAAALLLYEVVRQRNS